MHCIQAQEIRRTVGVVAGNTELCTVGRTGNDLHYRGYDILDIAERCEFEEIAYLLIHGKLPTLAELSAYKRSSRAARDAGGGAARARSGTRRCASDGRDAHGVFGTGLGAARKGLSTSSLARATSPTA